VPPQGIESAPVMALSAADLWPDDVPSTCVKRWERMAPFGTTLVPVAAFTFSSRAADAPSDARPNWREQPASPIGVQGR
jgi:hypothetical protein